MATISSLPSELISMIISVVYLYKEDIPEWKASLVLLSVSQEWRHIGTPIIYGTAILQVHSNVDSDSTDDEQSESDGLVDITNMWMSTNLGHIKKNGHLCAVRRLYICTPDNNVYDNMDLMIDWFLILMFDNKGAERLLRSIDAPGGNINESTLARVVASKVAEFLPNVNELCIEGRVADMALSEFFTEISRKYCGRLQYVAGTNPAGGFLAEALKPKRMTIHAEPLDEGETFGMVVPLALKSLEIVFHDVFYWDRIVDCNWAALNNITWLHLYVQSTNPWDISTAEKGPVYNQPRMLLPNLTTLVIYDAPLSLENCRDLMQSPVKTLQYSGCISVAGIMFQQLNLNSALENVVLNLSYEDDDPGCNFVQTANEIIAKTFNIKNVSLNLLIPEDVKPLWNKINWPHLTHACFVMCSGFENLIKIIPAMPNLVHLEIMYDISEKGSQKKLKSILRKLKQNINGPFVSKIQWLTIQLTGQIPQSSLIRSFAILKKYLPLAGNIYVASRRFCKAV